MKKNYEKPLVAILIVEEDCIMTTSVAGSAFFGTLGGEEIWSDEEN